MQRLENRFGRPEFMINIHIARVEKFKQFSNDDLNSLVHYSQLIQEMASSIELSGRADQQYNSKLLFDMLDKLSGTLNLQWATQRAGTQCSSISGFSQWLADMADPACTVIHSFSLCNVKKRDNVRQSSESINVHQEFKGGGGKPIKSWTVHNVKTYI